MFSHDVCQLGCSTTVQSLILGLEREYNVKWTRMFCRKWWRWYDYINVRSKADRCQLNLLQMFWMAENCTAVCFTQISSKVTAFKHKFFISECNDMFCEWWDIQSSCYYKFNANSARFQKEAPFYGDINVGSAKSRLCAKNQLNPFRTPSWQIHKHRAMAYIAKEQCCTGKNLPAMSSRKHKTRWWWQKNLFRSGVNLAI